MAAQGGQGGTEQRQTGQGREGPGRAKRDWTGSDRTGQGQTVPNSARKVRTGNVRQGRAEQRQTGLERSDKTVQCRVE